MPVKFPRPTSNKSGTKIASILHQIHGSLTTRRDPTAKDNWGTWFFDPAGTFSVSAQLA